MGLCTCGVSVAAVNVVIGELALVACDKWKQEEVVVQEVEVVVVVLKVLQGVVRVEEEVAGSAS